MKKNASAFLHNKYLETSLSALGILIVVIFMWAPFGWRTPDLTDGWRNFLLITKLNWGEILLKPYTARYLIFLPWKLGYLINPDSYLGIRVVMALTFWGKSLVFYLILQKLRLAPPYLAFLIAILFMLYPADQGNFLMRALGRHFSVLFYLVAVLFLIISAQSEKKILPVIIMLLAELVSGLMSEQGFLVMLITPAILLLDQSTSKVMRRTILAGWYAILFFCIGLFFVNLVSPPKSIYDLGNYQTNIFEKENNKPLAEMFQNIFVSNIVAYKLFFFGGWKISLKSIGDSNWIFLGLSLGAGIITTCIACLLSRMDVNETTDRYIPKYFWAVTIGGIFILVLSYLPYSLTSRNKIDYHIFYYAAIGGALATAYVFNRLIQSITFQASILNLVFFGILTVVISNNGLDQHSKLVQRSIIQQTVLTNIIEQAPVVLPHTKIVLLTDELNENFIQAPGFSDDRPFNWGSIWFNPALQWLYNDETITGVQCSTNTCFNQPIERLVVFQYTREHTAVLLDKIPDKYTVKNKNSYQPYKRIVTYVPFPDRYLKMFDVVPAPERVAPHDWLGSDTNMNDRKVCDVSHSGNCSLFFRAGSDASFTQTIQTHADTNNQIDLSFWSKTRPNVALNIPVATLTFLYMDGTQIDISVTAPMSVEWHQQYFTFTAKKTLTGIILTFQPNILAVSLWLDDIELYISSSNIPVTNPSFEQ